MLLESYSIVSISFIALYLNLDRKKKCEKEKLENKLSTQTGDSTMGRYNMYLSRDMRFPTVWYARPAKA